VGIELIAHGRRLRIARGVSQEMLHSLLLEVRTNGESCIEIAFRRGERVRIARDIDAAELYALLSMRPHSIEPAGQ